MSMHLKLPQQHSLSLSLSVDMISIDLYTPYISLSFSIYQLEVDLLATAKQFYISSNLFLPLSIYSSIFLFINSNNESNLPQIFHYILEVILLATATTSFHLFKPKLIRSLSLSHCRKQSPLRLEATRSNVC